MSDSEEKKETPDHMAEVLAVFERNGLKRSDGQPVTAENLAETVAVMIAGSAKLERQNAQLRATLKEVL